MQSTGIATNYVNIQSAYELRLSFFIYCNQSQAHAKCPSFTHHRKKNVTIYEWIEFDLIIPRVDNQLRISLHNWFFTHLITISFESPNSTKNQLSTDQISPTLISSYQCFCPIWMAHYCQIVNQKYLLLRFILTNVVCNIAGVSPPVFFCCAHLFKIAVFFPFKIIIENCARKGGKYKYDSALTQVVWRKKWWTV